LSRRLRRALALGGRSCKRVDPLDGGSGFPCGSGARVQLPAYSAEPRDNRRYAHLGRQFKDGTQGRDRTIELSEPQVRRRDIDPRS
jgi:hypothetical protein